MSDAKKKSVIIHIGLGRCGSSSIQRILRSSASNLKTAKIYYPELTPFDDATHALAPLRDESVPEAVERWKELTKTFAESELTTLLISSENFIGISEGLFLRLAFLLKPFHVRIIFLARNQTELLPSIYAYWKKVGILFKSFDHFFRVTCEQWNFHLIVERWSLAFGKQNIACGFLEENLDSVELFSHLTNNEEMVRIIKSPRNLRLNRSMHPTLLYLLELFDWISRVKFLGEEFCGWNRIEPVSLQDTPSLRQKFVNKLHNINEKFFKGKHPPLLTPQQQKTVADYYLISNKSFRTKYAQTRFTE
jgi:hypothetical protein